MKPLEIIIHYGLGGPLYFWDGSFVDKGIGGSEECLIMLAEALARQGNHVTVYNNCECSTIVNGVTYHPCAWAIHKTFLCDILISWRDWTLHQQVFTPGNALRLHCSHDIPVGCHAPAPGEETREALRHIDKFVFLNNHHRERHPWIPDESCAVIQSGLPPYTGPIVKRDLSRVLYISHPHRGLHVLRSVWPEVRRAVPEATLASFWWEPEHFLPPDEALSVLPMSHLGAGEIDVECRRAGIFGYPCVFEHEISPVTCMRAQAGGAYPVYIEQGGMRDAVQHGYRCLNVYDFTNSLIQALQKSIDGIFDVPQKDQEGGVGSVRERMMSWATSTFDWDRAAREYIELFWSRK